ncbi:hypothetical protein C7399_1673 [Paraburkholderia tropica]|uniref:Uncharacterized protein n=2 Tax=Paraburkholderia tropica TaxID=92647 RepID=A0ABX5MAP6_9BURK|nr:hypothetical protein C7400_1643 [Paraburkholderia tropica]PZW68168.1 hypothetical protein C7399_1673 [Paraburkholderia tropica]
MGLGMDVACIGIEKTPEIESAAALALLKLLRFANDITRCILTVTTTDAGYLTQLEIFSTRRAMILTEHYRSPKLLNCIDRVFTETQTRLSAFPFHRA